MNKYFICIIRHILITYNTPSKRNFRLLIMKLSFKKDSLETFQAKAADGNHPNDYLLEFGRTVATKSKMSTDICHRMNRTDGRNKINETFSTITIILGCCSISQCQVSCGIGQISHTASHQIFPICSPAFS